MKLYLKIFALIISASVGCSAAHAEMARAAEAFKAGDYKRAFNEFMDDAENGNQIAQFYVALLYVNGSGTAKNETEGLNWYKKSARKGYPPAQHNIAIMYKNGQGVEKNLTEAANWFKKAATQNIPASQYSLGTMYRYGDGVDQNNIEAAKWLLRAAELNYAAAQFDLGSIYANGQGVPKSNTHAYKWLTIAERNGIAQASDSKAILAGMMSETEMDRAVIMASDFLDAQAQSLGNFNNQAAQ